MLEFAIIAAAINISSNWLPWLDLVSCLVSYMLLSPCTFCLMFTKGISNIEVIVTSHTFGAPIPDNNVIKMILGVYAATEPLSRQPQLIKSPQHILIPFKNYKVLTLKVQGLW